jgi:DNA adenine methylase
MVEPFLRWAGGKRALLPQIEALLPSLNGDGRYFEPFVGGGAVYFGLKPQVAELSDLNDELILAYRAVRDHVDDVIEYLRPLRRDSDVYYTIRASRPDSLAERGGRFIYLNRTCWNGLYRVNLNGDFNVPLGRPKRGLVICDEDRLRAASEALQGTVIKRRDFGRIEQHARSGDLVYCDPPYTVAHGNNGFIEYNARVFDWHDQRRLARLAMKLVERSVGIVVSNADHPAVAALYPDSHFTRHTIPRWSTIASSPAKRFQTAEALFVGTES